MQILFERKHKQDNETHILGYTVVKFVGDRYCKCHLNINPNSQKNILQKELPGCDL